MTITNGSDHILAYSSGYNGALMINMDALNAVKMEVILDITVNEMNASSVGCVFTGGTYLLQNLIFHATGGWGSIRSNGVNNLGLAANLTNGSITVPATGLRKYGFSSTPNPDGSRTYKYWVNDVLVVETTHSAVANTAMLKVGLFMRSCTAKVYDITITDLS